MKERKLIVDTTLRDGEQSPFVHFTDHEKIELACFLDRIGVYQIEAGVSAIGVSEQRMILKIMEQKQSARISVWSRLQANDVKMAVACHPDVIHISIPVSYLHIYTKLGKNKAWIYKTLNEILEIIEVSGCRLSIGFEDASRADLSFLMKLVSVLEPFGTEMLRIADTVGVSSPSMIRNIVQTIRGFTNIPIEIHAHNDLGMAVANTAEALNAGALFADTTICGIGERSGNCDMVKLLGLMSHVYEMGISKDAAEEAQELFFRITRSHCGGMEMK